MKSKVSIEIEKREQGYSASSPEIEGYIAEGNSLDSVIDAIKQAIQSYWHQQEEETSKTTAQSLLELFENITADMTETEINNLPRDGAQQHDHYIYGIPKSDS
jgi:predicted RNase H-like HicB family nuclease